MNPVGQGLEARFVPKHIQLGIHVDEDHGVGALLEGAFQPVHGLVVFAHGQPGLADFVGGLVGGFGRP